MPSYRRSHGPSSSIHTTPLRASPSLKYTWLDTHTPTPFTWVPKATLHHPRRQCLPGPQLQVKQEVRSGSKSRDKGMMKDLTHPARALDCCYYTGTRTPDLSDLHRRF